MVRKIQGKGKSASVNHLKKNNDNITSKKDIANTLADSFSKIHLQKITHLNFEILKINRKNRNSNSHQIILKITTRNFYFLN